MDDLKELLNNEPCDAVHNNGEKSTAHKVSDNEPIDNEPIDNEPIDSETIDNEPNNNEPIDNEPADNESIDNEKKDKPNTGEKRDDIKKYNKPSKTLSSIEEIFKHFLCEKFMNKKYYVKIDKDKIVFYLICKPIKDFKMKNMIEISRDVITLAIEKEINTINEFITICIIDNHIKLNIAQTKNENKIDIPIIISNDEIVCNISTITNEYQKDISEVTKCTDKRPLKINK